MTFIRKHHLNGDSLPIKEQALCMSTILKNNVERTTIVETTPRIIIAAHHFKEPLPMDLRDSIDIITAAFMDLLIQFAYPNIEGCCNFTPTCTINTSVGPTSVNVSRDIKFTYADNTVIPKEFISAEIEHHVMKEGSCSDNTEVASVCIRFYSEGRKDGMVRPAIDEYDSILQTTLERSGCIKNLDTIKSRRTIKTRPKRSYSTFINRSMRHYSTFINKVEDVNDMQNKGIPTPRSFIVADIVPLLAKGQHHKWEILFPYSAGFMMVHPGKKPAMMDIHQFYADDYTIMDNIHDMCLKLLTNFFEQGLLKIIKGVLSYTFLIYHDSMVSLYYSI
jgi:hypothetical protein